MASQFAAQVIADTPPGELTSVIDDLQVLAEETPGLVRELDDQVAKYNIDQFTIVELEGGKKVTFNSLLIYLFYTLLLTS